MAEKIASMYAEISADTSKLKKGLGETKQSLKDAGKGVKDLSGLMLKSFGAITGGILVAKKAFDFAKEGAQLEFVRGKFDKLAATVGTSGDTMLSELRKVTRGVVSDSQLIASAADFMSLGLAKTSDQVVRLTRVAGALNMDMNQLVLTLANKTTMRFDQLGVAVDGFDERLKKLKESGLDVNAAFTEAFLQQAEAQVEKVGELADANAGSFARLEAATTNLADKFKQRLVPVLADAADALNLMLTWDQQVNNALGEQNNRLIETTGSYDEYLAKMREALWAAGQTADSVLILSEAEWEAAHAADVTAMRLQGLADASNDLTPAVDDSADAANKAWGQFYGLSRAIMAGKDAAEEAKPAVKSLLGEIDRNIDSPIAAFIKDLEWYRSGGRTFEKAFEDIKTALDEGRITPAEAQKYLEELYVGVTDFQEEIGQIDATEAANNISETLGASVEEAKEWINGTDSVMSALTAVTSKTWYIDITYRVNRPPSLLPGEGPVVDLDPGLVPGGAHGLNMIVPPGFPNDSYLVRASSGEQVNITSPGQGGNGDVYVVQNFYDQGAAALGMAYVETLRGQRLDASMGR